MHFLWICLFCTPVSQAYYINITWAKSSRIHVCFAYTLEWHYIKMLSHLVLFKMISLHNIHLSPVVSFSSYENSNTQMWSPCRKCSYPTVTERFGSSSTMLNMIFGWVLPCCCMLLHTRVSHECPITRTDIFQVQINVSMKTSFPLLWLAENLLGHVNKGFLMLK